MIPAVPIGVFGLGFVLATVLVMRGAWQIFLGAFGLVIMVFAYCWLVPKSGEGFDDIGYAIVAFLVCIPLGGGLLGGAIMGWLVRRVRAQRAGWPE